MDWKPKAPISGDCSKSEPTKPSKPGFVGFDGSQLVDSPKIEAEAAAAATSDLGAILHGKAIELWSDAAGGRLFIVADERDIALLNQRRGEVLTAEELRLVVKITDPATAAQVLRWKRMFDGRLSESSGTVG